VREGALLALLCPMRTANTLMTTLTGLLHRQGGEVRIDSLKPPLQVVTLARERFTDPVEETCT